MAERPASRDPFELCGTTIVAKYRITELVGSGGFGVVYKGEHLDLGEPVAVKCLKSPPEFAPEERERLLAVLRGEAKTLHKLCGLTSNIVRLLDVGATTSRGQWVPYLVLEWLDGETLNEHLRARAEQSPRGMPLAEAVDLLEPAARALGVAHRQKVAHRDVKPDNLFLTHVGGKPVLKVLDFGIAKTMADASYTAAQNATMKHPSAFTPSYGAPEQFNKKRGPTGTWTDVFALALILVEVVSGERALDGDDPTQLYIAAADPAARPTLRHRGIETTDLVEAVLRRALAIDPQDRYPDADAFWDALRDAMAGRSTQTPRVDVSETGEFVTRHAIDVDVRPGAAREPPTAGGGARPARAAKEAPVAEPTERSAGAPSVSSAVTKELGVRVVESADADETGKPSAGSAPTALDAGGAH
ncbi:MAG: serine/threonine protein kinase, partial [Myxococcales bacterium]|nr:serine/threonine protein kinase [Myxococcales bacterium]